MEIKIANNKRYEYDLSELLFEVKNNETLEQKYSLISSDIKLIGFKNSALKHSIANSSDKGGEIGWVKETLLSEKLNNLIARLKIGEFSKAIKYPNGYLILNINNKREMKQIIDKDKELSELIKFERNRQLNQYSLLYYKKLKQNTNINEY